MKRGKILIVDDNEDILFTLKMLLRPIAESITTLNDPRELLPIISRTRFDVILLDMNFRQDAVSGKEGFHWLEEILKLDAKAVVIFITAYADTEKAVQAIKQGATDFIPKPWQNEKLIATVSSALQLSFSRTEVETLKQPADERYSYHIIRYPYYIRFLLLVSYPHHFAAENTGRDEERLYQQYHPRVENTYCRGVCRQRCFA